MISTVTTNAMLVTQKKAQLLAESTAFVAVSLDGTPESHNRNRGHPAAFQSMERGIKELRDAGVRFGFIFTLTQNNLDELAWVARYAVNQGAHLLQVHPLEDFGRAQSTLCRSVPDALELARGFVESAHLQEEFQGKITIQYDVADTDVLRVEPARGFAGDLANRGLVASLEAVGLADIVSPLVVEADGTVVPLQYGIDHRFRIGEISSEKLRDEITAWKKQTLPKFLNLCDRVHKRVTQDTRVDFSFVNWYREVLHESFV